jgi:ankyrin repeat protein
MTMPDRNKELLKAAKSGDVETVQALLVSDPSVLLARDIDGSTALHCAAWKGHHAIVALLLSHGADVHTHNSNDHWGTTPLHAAAHANHARIAELLIAHGADVNAEDRSGRTPLQHTLAHKAIQAAKVLQAHGAK